MGTLIKKTKLLDQIKHKDGIVSLWGHPCFLQPVIGVLAKNQLTEQLTNSETLHKIDYFAEKYQGYMGMRITGEKFGYAKTLKNKKDLLLFCGDQFELLGYGKVEWVRMDFKNEIFIVRLSSPYAKIYIERFGTSKKSVDYWNAGGWAATVEYVIKKKVVCIETSCMAQGKPYCEFVIKPIEKWDQKDPVVKNNSFLFEDVKIELGKTKF